MSKKMSAAATRERRMIDKNTWAGHVGTLGVLLSYPSDLLSNICMRVEHVYICMFTLLPTYVFKQNIVNAFYRNRRRPSNTSIRLAYI